MTNQRLSELRYKGHITDSEYKELKLAIKALENERPSGEWIKTGREVASLDEMKALGNIPHGNFTWKKCSNCGSEEIYEMPFCPHCGADMGFPKHKGIEHED